MYKRRKNRGYRRFAQVSGRRNANVNFVPVIFMLCLSIGCGYMAAKYVVEPVVNYVPQVAESSDKIESSSKVVEDEAEVKEVADVVGYALQYGCYSGKASAEAAEKTLEVEGTQIIEQNNMYKITGQVYKTKEEAKEALKKLPDGVAAFVTEIYK